MADPMVNTVQFYAVGALIGLLLLVIAFKGQGGGRNQTAGRRAGHARWSTRHRVAATCGDAARADVSSDGTHQGSWEYSPSHDGSWHYSPSHHGPSHHDGFDAGSSWGSDGGSPTSD